MLTLGSGSGSATVVKLSTAAASTAFGITLGRLRNIQRTGVEADMVEIHTLDDAPNKTFDAGWIDGGEVPMTVLYTPDTTTNGHAIMNSMFLNRAGGRLKVIHPTTTITEEFDFKIRSIGREYPIDNFIAQDYTLKVTGAPGLST